MKITCKEMFEKKTVAELKEIAARGLMKGYGKMKKAELVELCTTAVCQDGFLEEILYRMPDYIWNFYRKVIDNNGVEAQDIDEADYAVTEYYGLISVENTKKGKRIIVPEELKKVYSTLVKNGFLERKQRADLVYDYAHAAVNLYGVIEFMEFVNLFNSQNEMKITEGAAYDILEPRIYAGGTYRFFENYLVHEGFEINDFADVDNVITEAYDKLRYVPEKEELLRYSGGDYYEETPEILALEQFLKKDMGMDAAIQANDILFELKCRFFARESLEDYLEVFEERNIQIQQSELLSALIMSCAATTRCWENKGHTNRELQRSAETKTTKKVGRNDPCPCGSGKKYKKCCGKE